MTEGDLKQYILKQVEVYQEMRNMPLEIAQAAYDKYAPVLKQALESRNGPLIQQFILPVTLLALVHPIKLQEGVPYGISIDTPFIIQIAYINLGQ